MNITNTQTGDLSSPIKTPESAAWQTQPGGRSTANGTQIRSELADKEIENEIVSRLRLSQERIEKTRTAIACREAKLNSRQYTHATGWNLKGGKKDASLKKLADLRSELRIYQFRRADLKHVAATRTRPARAVFSRASRRPVLSREERITMLLNNFAAYRALRLRTVEKNPGPRWKGWLPTGIEARLLIDSDDESEDEKPGEIKSLEHTVVLPHVNLEDIPTTEITDWSLLWDEGTGKVFRAIESFSDWLASPYTPLPAPKDIKYEAFEMSDYTKCEAVEDESSEAIEIPLNDTKRVAVTPAEPFAPQSSSSVGEGKISPSVTGKVASAPVKPLAQRTSLPVSDEREIDECLRWNGVAPIASRDVLFKSDFVVDEDGTSRPLTDDEKQAVIAANPGKTVLFNRNIWSSDNKKRSLEESVAAVGWGDEGLVRESVNRYWEEVQGAEDAEEEMWKAFREEVGYKEGTEVVTVEAAEELPMVFGAYIPQDPPAECAKEKFERLEFEEKLRDQAEDHRGAQAVRDHPKDLAERFLEKAPEMCPERRLLLSKAILSKRNLANFEEWKVCDMPQSVWDDYIEIDYYDNCGSMMGTCCGGRNWNMQENIEKVELVYVPYKTSNVSDYRPIRDKFDPFVDDAVEECQPLLKITLIKPRNGVPHYYLVSDLRKIDRMLDDVRFDRRSVGVLDCEDSCLAIRLMLRSWFTPVITQEEVKTSQHFARLNLERYKDQHDGTGLLRDVFLFQSQPVSRFMLNELLSRQVILPPKMSANHAVERIVRKYSEDSFSNSYSVWKLHNKSVLVATVNLAIGIVVKNMTAPISDF